MASEVGEFLFEQRAGLWASSPGIRAFLGKGCFRSEKVRGNINANLRG